MPQLIDPLRPITFLVNEIMVRMIEFLGSWGRLDNYLESPVRMTRWIRAPGNVNIFLIRAFVVALCFLGSCAAKSITAKGFAALNGRLVILSCKILLAHWISKYPIVAASYLLVRSSKSFEPGSVGSWIPWPLTGFSDWDFVFCMSDRSAMSEIKTDLRKSDLRSQ